MLEPNNPDIDSEALAQRIRQVERQGERRVLPPFPDAPEGSLRGQPQPDAFPIPPERKTTDMIDAVSWKARIRAIPLLGGLLRWLYAFFGLFRFKMQVLAVHEQIFARQREALARQDELHREALARQDALHREALARQDELHREALARQDALHREALAKQESLVGDLHRLRRDTEQLFARLRQELRLLQQPPGGQASPPAEHGGAVSARLDGFYAAFEDAFRGDRASIKSRQAAYLPYLSRGHAGTSDAPVLDIGCGRGEWLELLGENGLAARGVDLNALFVEQCRNHGFEVIHGDAVACLAALPDGALGAVTGFHIAEHLPFDTLVGLLDEVLRVLRPGGTLILETPNPENLLVGALNFYDDPTHRNPLTPRAMDFLARQRGYSATEILRLNPYPPSFHVVDPSPLAERFNGLFYGPQDYALIAVK
jgi:O-antigen chain-terminating methyltransferase